MTSTHEGYLRLPHLSQEARKTHLFPSMQSSLISVGPLCDSGCIAAFDQDKVVVMFDNHVFLTGHRNHTTGMWQVQLPTPHIATSKAATEDLPGPNILQHAAHAAVAAESMPDCIVFLHACAGSPAISSFCTAIHAAYYTTWPNLTSARVRQHLKEHPPLRYKDTWINSDVTYGQPKRSRKPPRSMHYQGPTKRPRTRKNAATTSMWNASPSAEISTPTSQDNPLSHQQVETGT